MSRSHLLSPLWRLGCPPLAKWGTQWAHLAPTGLRGQVQLGIPIPTPPFPEASIFTWPLSSQAPQMLGEGMGSRGEGPTYSVLGRPGSWLLPGCPPALLGAGRRCLAPVPPPHWLCPPVGKQKGQCSPGPRANGKASRFLGRARGKPTALRRESESVRQGQQQ